MGKQLDLPGKPTCEYVWLNSVNVEELEVPPTEGAAGPMYQMCVFIQYVYQDADKRPITGTEAEMERVLVASPSPTRLTLTEKMKMMPQIADTITVHVKEQKKKYADYTLV